MYILAVILSVFLALPLNLVALRKVKQKQLTKSLSIQTQDGIDESRFVTIGGIEQWVQIRGENKDKPVLLFVHGGPGVSYVPFSPVFREWEKHFTVVQWDQRGAGKTYGRNPKGGSDLNIDRMVKDGLEVTDYLRRHLKKQKVVLFCHSWGTILGTEMARRRPELFYAYVGAGQVVAMERSEPDSYDMLLEQVKDNPKALKAAQDLGRPPYADMQKWMIKQRMIVMTSPPPAEGKLPNIMTAPLVAPGYSLKDAKDWMAAFTATAKDLYPAFMSYDACNLGTKFELPMVILQGEKDLQAPTSEARKFFDAIQAPSKRLTVFPGEGHPAVLSNPGLYLKELLAHVQPLTQR